MVKSNQLYLIVKYRNLSASNRRDLIEINDSHRRIPPLTILSENNSASCH